MAINDIVQTIAEARVDARSLSDFMFYPASEMITRRLAPSIHTLNYYLDYFNGLEALYSQESGTVTVNGVEIKTVRQAMSDAIDDVLLGEYQEGIRSDLNDQKLDTGITVTAKSGGVVRTQAEKNSDYISIKDFGLVADGVTDDSLKVQNIESELTGRRIDMLGKTVVVDALPTNNNYYSGWFKISGVLYRSNLSTDNQVSNTNVIIGANTPDRPLDSTKSLVVIGNGAMENATNGHNSIAIGPRALKNMTYGKFNIAIGLESQFYVSSTDGGSSSGTRNVSVGDNSLRFNEVGRGNVVMGRNAGQCITDSRNVAIGGGAMSGWGSLKFTDYNFINNETPISSKQCVALGTDALFYGAGDNCVAVGTNTLSKAKSGAISSIAIGTDALSSIGVHIGIHGGQLIPKNDTCTYTMTTSDCVITLTAHGIKVNDYVKVRYLTGVLVHNDSHFCKVIAVTTNTFTIAEPYGVVTSGTVKLEHVEDMAVTTPTTSRNVAIGVGAMYGATHGQYNTAVGANAVSKISGGNYNTAVGDTALGDLEGASSANTAIGFQALRYNVDGTGCKSANNRVGIGSGSRCSADNQIQLGVTGQSTYTFGAVQDRSDARDKIIEGDVTDAHINFFNAVEFKRYRLDYRDDYLIANNDGTVTKLDKDGSKARKREHVGVIAQQVEQAMKAHNVDFAGLQHHAVNGGNDVYTVGYQEFIPILGEIVQRQQKQIDELKALIEK